MLNNCSSLESVTLPSSWGSITDVSYMLSGCSKLKSLTLPTLWGSITNASFMLSGCFGIKSITLPASWGNITNASRMLMDCSGLESLTLPVTFGSITDVSYMLSGCSKLKSLTLPASWGSVIDASCMMSSCGLLQSVVLPATYGVRNAMYILSYCASLRQVTNLEYLGSNTFQTNMGMIMDRAEEFQQSITIGVLLSEIGIIGNADNNVISKITSIRLSNPGSLFEGIGGVNVSWTSLDETALNLLFGDLPTLEGKIIYISGCTGADTCDRSIAAGKGWTVDDTTTF
jgi:hypothetical protein